MEAIWNLIKTVPGECVPYLKQFGEKIGVGVFQMADWFMHHPSELLQFVADVEAGNVNKAIDDLTAAWKASHESPAA